MKAISANPQYTLLRTSPFLSEGAPVITYAGDIPAIRRGVEDTAASGDKSYKVYYAVVEADSVLVSNDVTGHKNPAIQTPIFKGLELLQGMAVLLDCKMLTLRELPTNTKLTWQQTKEEQGLWR